MKKVKPSASIKSDKIMKKKIHPIYFEKAKVTCACGNVFSIGSTKELIEVEICSQCHPFYTGKEKIIDVMGRVDRFKKRLAKKGAPKKKKVRTTKQKK